jgi:TonB family protein
MRLSRIVHPLLLTLAMAACAANAGAGASASAGGAEAGARSLPVLQNRAEALRLMRSRYPQHLQDARAAGEVVVVVTLDAAGAVTESTIRRSSHASFSEAALLVSRQLRFSRPAAAGERVNVRMLFSDMSRSSIAVVD